MACVPEVREAMEAASEQTQKLARDIRNVEVACNNDIKKLESFGGSGVIERSRATVVRSYIKAMCMKLYTRLLCYEDNQGRVLSGVFYKVGGLCCCAETPLLLFLGPACT